MEKMINKWLADGLINQELAEVLTQSVKEEKAKLHRTRLNICIYTVSAILIGIGIIAFISANDWLLALLTSLPILKILIMLVLTVSSLFFGYKLVYEKNKFPKLGHAMIFLSALLIGGTYALTGQTYHINAHNSSLMFLWLLSILPVAYIFKNFAVNVVAIVLYILGIIYYYMELHLDLGLTWTVFIPILLGATLYSVGNIPVIVEKFNNFSMSYKLTGLAPIFVTLLILTCSAEATYKQTSLYYIIPIVLLIGLNLINFLTNKNRKLLFKIETGYIVVLLLFLLLIISLTKVAVPAVMVFANLAIIAMIACGYNYGHKFEHNNMVALSNWFLIIYLTVNYCRWGWDMQDKALFFILGGIGLLAIGMFLENKRKKIINKDN